MARQIGFHFYSFRIWQKHHRSVEVLSSLRGQQDALFLLLKGFRSALGKQFVDEAAHRVYKLTQIDNLDRHITGVIEAGHYGEAADIVHNKTGKRSHRQHTDEATLLPCFFRLVIDEHVERGLLILQRDNRVPAKPSLERVINTILHRFDGLLVCGMEPVVNAATFRKMIGNGEVQRLRFVQTSLPKDFADAYARGRKEVRGIAEVRFSASKNQSLPLKNLLLGWLRAPQTLEQYEIPGFGDFEFDTVKAELRIGRKVQLVDFGRRMTHPIVDVTAQVDLDVSTGHPTYESLQTITGELADNETYTAYGD